MDEKIKVEWEQIILMGKESPYLFRTRLGRAITHSMKYAKKVHDCELEELCNIVKNKLDCISDQSNQTADGSLNSFTILRQDFQKIIDHMIRMSSSGELKAN